MAEQLGLLGRKLGMTQVFADNGERVPVTVIQTGPCHVVAIRTPERDGYSAIQLGFEERPARLLNKPENGQFKKANLSPKKVLQELRVPAEVAVPGAVRRPPALPRGLCGPR